MMTSTPPDPSHRIPPEARGRVRRKKKVPARGGAGGGREGVPGELTSRGVGGMEGGRVGRESGVDADRTFVTSRDYGDRGEAFANEEGENAR